MAVAVKKKALMLSPAFATINVDKEVPERHKYGISDQSVFERERSNTRNLGVLNSTQMLLPTEPLKLWNEADKWHLSIHTVPHFVLPQATCQH